MKRIRHRAMIVAALAALALCACQAEAPTPAPAATATADTAATGTAAAESALVATEVATTMAEPGVQPDASGADARALAGTWTGLLPCADCPGIDETLVLDADGGFVLTDTYRERPDATFVTQGTWALEAEGRHVRLDPGNKDDADRLFAIESGSGSDALVRLDPAGKRIDSPFDMRLVRER